MIRCSETSPSGKPDRRGEGDVAVDRVVTEAFVLEVLAFAYYTFFPI